MTVASVLIIYIVSYVVFGLILGFLCSYIAGTKNRNKVGFFFLGLFLGVIGIIVAAAVPKLHEEDFNENRSLPQDDFEDNEDLEEYEDLETAYPYLLKHTTETGLSTPVFMNGASTLPVRIEYRQYLFGMITEEYFHLYDEDSSAEVFRISLEDIEEVEHCKDEEGISALLITAGKKGFNDEIELYFSYVNVDDGRTLTTEDIRALRTAIKTRKALLGIIPVDVPFEQEAPPDAIPVAQMNTAVDVPVEQGTKECPFCAEIIKAKAIKCKHCGSTLDGTQ